MQVTETLSAGLKREYKVVVNAAELDKELNAKLADLSKRANIKGFRPGKVPVPHLKRVYGKSAMAEVVQKAIDDRVEGAARGKEAQARLPAGSEAARGRGRSRTPSWTARATSPSPWRFEVIPDFEVKDHSGLELTRHVVEVTEDQIDETLNALRLPVQELRGKGRRGREGRPLTISFVGTIDGTPSRAARRRTCRWSSAPASSSPASRSS